MTRLRFSRQTPFTATGAKGRWVVKWRSMRRKYELWCDERLVGEYQYVADATAAANRIENGMIQCACCGGSGWVSGNKPS